MPLRSNSRNGCEFPREFAASSAMAAALTGAIPGPKIIKKTKLFLFCNFVAMVLPAAPLQESRIAYAFFALMWRSIAVTIRVRRSNAHIRGLADVFDSFSKMNPCLTIAQKA
jgi:hypothetical protein